MGHIQVGRGEEQAGSSVPAPGRWTEVGAPGPPGRWRGLTEHTLHQANAELAVRDMLRAFGTSRQARGLPLEVSAEDHMDDGSPIRLRVQIDVSEVSLGRKDLPRHQGRGHPAADFSPPLWRAG